MQATVTSRVRSDSWFYSRYQESSRLLQLLSMMSLKLQVVGLAISLNEPRMRFSAIADDEK